VKSVKEGFRAHDDADESISIVLSLCCLVPHPTAAFTQKLVSRAEQSYIRLECISRRTWWGFLSVVISPENDASIL